MEGVKVVNDEAPVDKFELTVLEKAVGSLTTNIEGLEKFARERLKDYTPELFKGDSDSAKKARAELNKAVDTIKRKRIDIINEFMSPVADFENRCKALEKEIGVASGNLDLIVKEKEREEKEIKREKINCLWLNKKFELFPIERIFNDRWLNKGYKMADIEKEIDTAIEKTYKDLKQIEKYADSDIDVLKAYYLDCLDMGDVFDYAEQLKKNREAVQKEALERDDREHEQKIAEQKSELTKEAEGKEKAEEISSLAELALTGQIAKPKRQEFVITVNVFDSELLKVKEMLNELGIEFKCEKLDF